MTATKGKAKRKIPTAKAGKYLPNADGVIEIPMLIDGRKIDSVILRRKGSGYTLSSRKAKAAQ